MVVLIVQFKQKETSLEQFRAMSESGAPVINAQPGFRSKLWLGDEETGEYAGVYQFETKKDAKAYVQSEVMATIRSLPTIDGEVTCKIYDLVLEQKS